MVPSSTAAVPPASSDDELRLERLRQRRKRYPLWRLILATIFDFGVLVRESRIALLGFSVLSAIATAYLLLNDTKLLNKDLSFAEALFETMQMFVLEGSITPPRGDLLGTLIVFITPLLGLALIFQSVLNFGRLLLDKGSRREAWQVSLATTFRDHVIVCGLGRVNYRVMLQLLDAGYEVVVIEQDWSSDFVPTALRLHVPVVKGDARDPDILRQARIDRARGLIAGINDDLLNVEIALSAQRQRPNIQVVMRIFSQELDTSLERSFGRGTAFSSSALAAPTLAAAAVSREIVHVLPLPDGLLGVSELRIAAESELSGFVQKVEDSFDVRVLRHRDARGRERRPGLMSRLEGGDVVLLLGTLEALEQVRERNRQGSKLDFLRSVPLQHPTPRFNTVIICGLGKVGYRVVKEVLRSAHPRPEIVVICGDNTRNTFIEELQELGVRIVIGDAREASVLQTAGIERAYSVAALTANNLVNLQIGLVARQIRPDVHLVLRVFSDVLAERLAPLFGIHTVFSASALAAPTLAAATVVLGIDYAIDIGERLFSTITLTVRAGDEFYGKTVSQVRDQAAVLVIAAWRNELRIQPIKLDFALCEGDRLVVLVDIARLSSLQLRGEPSGEAKTRHLLARQTRRLDQS